MGANSKVALSVSCCKTTARAGEKRRGLVSFLLSRCPVQSAKEGGNGLGYGVPDRGAAALLRGAARVHARRIGSPQGDPEAVEQRIQMFAALAGEKGRVWVLRDKRLAEEGFAYLSEKGKRHLKHIDELTPF